MCQQALCGQLEAELEKAAAALVACDRYTSSLRPHTLVAYDLIYS
jgi:hypothetical protein